MMSSIETVTNNVDLFKEKDVPLKTECDAGNVNINILEEVATEFVDVYKIKNEIKTEDLLCPTEEPNKSNQQSITLPDQYLRNQEKEVTDDTPITSSTVQPRWPEFRGFVNHFVGVDDPLKFTLDRKRYVSSFVLFGAEVRKKTMNENPGKKFGEISRIIAGKWRELDEDTKHKYEELAIMKNEEKVREQIHKESIIQEIEKNANPKVCEKYLYEESKRKSSIISKTLYTKKSKKAKIWDEIKLCNPNLQGKEENTILCPFPVNKCAERMHKGLADMTEHLNNHHFRTLVDTKLREEQNKNRNLYLPTECPYKPCGFYASARFELLRHYGQQHQVTAQFLKDAAGEDSNEISLIEVTSAGFFKKKYLNLANYDDCSICWRKVHKLHLSEHKALVHLKLHYVTEISQQQSRSSVPQEKCPQPNCSFEVKKESTQDFQTIREILLIKHYQIHLSVTEVVKQYKTNGGK